MDILEQFKKKFARALLTKDDEDVVRRMTEFSVKVDKENKKVEIHASFAKVEQPRLLFALEDLLRTSYGLNEVRIFPKYPAETFTPECVKGLISLLKRVTGSGVSYGFFEDCVLHYQPERGVLEISLRRQVSPAFVTHSGAAVFLTECIRHQFGLDIGVFITGDEVNPATYEAPGVAAMRKAAREEAKEEVLSVRGSILQESKSMALEFFGPDAAIPEQTEDGKVILKVGNMTFDITEPKPVYGTLKNRSPLVPIKMLRKDTFVSFVGKLFSWEEKENYDKPKNSFKMFVTDGEASVMLRFQAEKGTSFPKAPAYVLVEGKAQFSDFDGELVIRVSAMATVKALFRKETNPTPRVELHCHTNMSAMDAMTDPGAMMKRAQDWGCPALAITDHGNLQAFPEIMKATKKCPDVKPIYGMEGYLVDDTARAVFFYSDERDNKNFEKDEFVVFDLETTGLSVQNCGITQIAAVLYRGGEIGESFETFVNPGMPIPENITQLTGITDDMVKDAPDVETAVKAFLAFADGRMLVAHNASFDASFIRKACADYGMEFNCPCLDTVALSRFINSDINRHTLDSLAKYFKLGDFDHHRANEDTEMLAKIFGCLIGKLAANGIFTTGEMVTAMAENSDPKKLKNTYHIVLLAKNETGLKNLYKLVSYSYLNYFNRHPRIPKTVLKEHREGLIIGSACIAGEFYQAVVEGKPFGELCKIAEMYDYLEIQPWTNNWFMYEDGKLDSNPNKALEQLHEYDRTVIRVADKLKKPVCATGDVHFLEPEDELFRKILQMGQGFSDGGRDTKLYFKTTDEMLEAFSFLGEEKAREVVIDNPRMIADSVEFLKPIPDGQYTPEIPGADEDLIRTCEETAKKLYGDPIPEIVKARMDRELNSIIKNGFAVLYIIARNLVRNSEENGYYVGSRGSVGSSFVASLAHISEVNPLPPHWRCPSCKHSEFITDGSYGSGFDMPDKNCPHCGTKMTVDGHDIPFETFLGFHGEKAPDIDLNFSGDVQSAAHKYTEVLFGKENIFRAGTVSALQSKTCFGFVKHYVEDLGKDLTRAEIERLIDGCIGVKRTTGQHPGGIVVIPKQYQIYDFTPVQYPAEKESSGVITTHFAFEYLHDTLLKLDILGHDVPTFYRILEEYTGRSVMALPMNDVNVYELFKSTKPLGITPKDIDCNLGTFGLPEFGTKYAIQMIEDAKPQNFSDLLQISGLSHGTGIWLGNGKDLIANGTCSIHEIIGTRDSIMIYLMQKGLDSSVAFTAMERTRKGKGLTEDLIVEMKKCDVPDWYIESCQKIKYMFPKAHAAAYTIAALRLGWFKVYEPVAFYAAYFTIKADTFDGGLVMQGLRAIKAKMRELQNAQNLTAKDEDMLVILNLVADLYARGVEFLPVNIFKSHAFKFLPEDGKVRLPFTSLSGLGQGAAERIQNAVATGRVTTVEELSMEPGVGKSVVEMLRNHGCLDDLPESNQFTLF